MKRLGAVIVLVIRFRCLIGALLFVFVAPAAVAQQIAPKGQVPINAPELITTRVAGIELKLLPADEFVMGSPGDDRQADHDEKPQHRVRLRQPFYLGVFEITQAQYEAVMGINPSSFSATGRNKVKVFGMANDRRPVEQVSWLDAVMFCHKLSQRESRAPFYAIDGEKVEVRDWSGLGYRLPTEAEWEYACRGNVHRTSRFCFGDDASILGDFAWFHENSENRTHAVGSKRPNAFGLFDMHGNVSEWCWDRGSREYYDRSPADDPRGPDRSGIRVTRGGHWFRIPLVAAVHFGMRSLRELGAPLSDFA